MSTPQSNFEALEKQLAKDALEKALKALHGEINKEIIRNKKVFEDEIKKTLSRFTEGLEQHISKEIDQKLPTFLNKNFSDISNQVKSNFEQMFIPVLDRTEEDMKRLHRQGENTLHSWERMIKQYDSLWTKPFFLVFASSILTGTTICLTLFFLKTSFAAYMFMDVRARKAYESDLRWLEAVEKVRAEKKQKNLSRFPKTKPIKNQSNSQ